MIKVYGIKNCDTVKKAIKELNELGIEFDFIDFKKESPKKDWILRWEKFWGELPANKRGPTFRKIKEGYESSNKSGQIKLLIENSSAIKRPVLEKNGKVLNIGFKSGDYKGIF
tara:strand:+ start:1957 stop:2295 length:339 start_codon:yes stop_codon:yes gene_type:complete